MKNDIPSVDMSFTNGKGTHTCVSVAKFLLLITIIALFSVQEPMYTAQIQTHRPSFPHQNIAAYFFLIYS